jgi:hypothetical protein
MTPYINDDGSQASYPLSPEEIMQLWRLSADDIDFSTPCPQHANCAHSPDGTPGSAKANDYSMIGPVPTRRYPSVRGWDQFTGYGRANYGQLLRMIGRDGDATRVYGDPQLKAQDRIPPEADISSPLWWTQYAYKPDNTLLNPGADGAADAIVVQGRVAANRVTSTGGHFDWILEWAPGAQGEPWPQGQSPAEGSAETSSGPWVTVAGNDGLARAYSGELGRIPIAAIVAAQAGYAYPFAVDPTSPYQPEQYAIRLRVRVIAHPANALDTVNNEAVFQKQVDVYPATESVIRDDLGRNGARGGTTPSPSFEDIDGDGRDELLIASDDGLVHAYTDVAAGTELPGWPVHTLPLASLPASGTNAFTRGDVASDFYTGILGGAVAVADLDNSGHREVIAADMEGRVYAWEADGSLRRGFPVTVDYSITKETPCGPTTIPNCDDYESNGKKRDRYNRRNAMISFAPSVGDLDSSYPGLEIVASAGDGHVYAWHADGTPVPGWPVVLRAPHTVATMDPQTQFYTFNSNVQAEDGGMVLVTPSLGDIDGDGELEVVVGVNEEYLEKPNAPPSLDNLLALLASTGQVSPGNTRFYALHHDGTLHPADAGDVNPDVASTPHTEDQAYLKGWPVKVAMITTDQLPTVGEGTDAPAVLADLDGDGKPEVIAISAAGPGYIFSGDGSSWLGSSGGQANILDINTPAADKPAFGSLGALSVGSLDGGGHLSVVANGAGLQRVLDIAIEGDQYKAEDQLGFWDVRSGSYEPGGAVVVNDLQFFVQPTIADLDGDGRAEAIEGSAVNDLVTVSLTDKGPSVVRLHTGGWTDSAAAVGAAPIGSSAASTLSIATTTREGYLRVIPAATPIDGHADCVALSQWPRYQHDAHNSGNYGTDAEPPAPARDVKAVIAGDGSVQVNLTASGDDRYCGRADHYEVRSASAGDDNWLDATPIGNYVVNANAGQADQFTIRSDQINGVTYLLRIFDKAGNGSAVAPFSAQLGGNTQGSPPASSSSGAFDPLLLGLLALAASRRRCQHA